MADAKVPSIHGGPADEPGSLRMERIVVRISVLAVYSGSGLPFVSGQNQITTMPAM
jgi:hypothetical protein